MITYLTQRESRKIIDSSLCRLEEDMLYSSYGFCYHQSSRKYEQYEQVKLDHFHNSWGMHVFFFWYCLSLINSKLHPKNSLTFQGFR